MLGALILGLFCGIVARMFVPGDMFRDMSGLSALIGTIIILVIATLVFRRTSSRPSLYPLPRRQASGHDLSHTVQEGEYDSGKHSRWWSGAGGSSLSARGG